MAKLKVIFPHSDELGEQFAAGDYREVPNELVDFYLKPLLPWGLVCLAIDPEVWQPEPEEEVAPASEFIAPSPQEPIGNNPDSAEILQDESEIMKSAKKKQK